MSLRLKELVSCDAINVRWGIHLSKNEDKMDELQNMIPKCVFCKQSFKNKRVIRIDILSHAHFNCYFKGLKITQKKDIEHIQRMESIIGKDTDVEKNSPIEVLRIN